MKKRDNLGVFPFLRLAKVQSLCFCQFNDRCTIGNILIPIFKVHRQIGNIHSYKKKIVKNTVIIFLLVVKMPSLLRK